MFLDFTILYLAFNYGLRGLLPMKEHASIGQVIRELRRARNMTGEELGKRVGLSQSKISKVESGAGANLAPEGLKRVLAVLDAPQTVRQQAMAMLDQRHDVQVRRFRTQSTAIHEQSLKNLQDTTLLRTFTFSLVPALLQTVAYREVFLRHTALAGNDMQKNLRLTLKRQDLLWNKNRHTHFITHEAALYSSPGDRDTQVGQLDRIDRLADSRTIKIGLIALETNMPPVDLSSFTLFDERILVRSVAGADITSTDRDDIAEHLKIFALLDRVAEYGDGARTIVRKAMDHFS